MSTTQPRTRLSGCARRRAKAIARRDHVTKLTHRREDAAFYDHGTIPLSATSVSMCSCGARSFGRGEMSEADYDAERDWSDAHADCGEVTS